MIAIYHSKDLDGLFSGAVVKHKYPDAQLIGYDYIDDYNPIINQIADDEEVIIIDVTFPINILQELGERCELTVIDHHVSFNNDVKRFVSDNITSFDDLSFVYIYDKNVSACELGWRYLFESPIPVAINLIGRLDTWREYNGDFWNQYVLPFQYAMRLMVTSPEEVNESMFSASLKDIEKDIEIGNYIIKYQQNLDAQNCGRAAFERVAFGKYNAICVNLGLVSTTTFASVYDPNKHDIMIGFQYVAKGKWSVSLRCDKPDIDVSLIAKSNGGGGHKAAAGYEANTFEEIFV